MPSPAARPPPTTTAAARPTPAGRAGGSPDRDALRAAGHEACIGEGENAPGAMAHGAMSLQGPSWLIAAALLRSSNSQATASVYDDSGATRSGRSSDGITPGGPLSRIENRTG